MKLAEDFSVRKVMSVREELWMTDGDWAKTTLQLLIAATFGPMSSRWWLQIFFFHPYLVGKNNMWNW